MIRIQILSDGSVVGDVGRVIAYENQSRSEVIQFTYPAIRGIDSCIKKVKYYWGSTQFQDLLDANDKVVIHVHGSGIVEMQFVAENPVTGEALLVSKPFQLIVHKGLQAADVFSNCYRNNVYDNCMPNNLCGGNLYEAMIKLGIEVSQESQVRASQDSAIWEEIFNIKNKLSEAGITTTDPVPVAADCNELINSGETYLSEGSKHTPEDSELSEGLWIIQVRRMISQVLQTIYSAKSGDSSVYYRTGTVDNDTVSTWTNWIPMIHETSVTEIVSE